MKNTLTIAGRQFRSYFNGPIAYIVVSLVLIILGFLFWETFFLFGRATLRAARAILSRASGEPRS